MKQTTCILILLLYCTISYVEGNTFSDTIIYSDSIPTEQEVVHAKDTNFLDENVITQKKETEVLNQEGRLRLIKHCGAMGITYFGIATSALFSDQFLSSNQRIGLYTLVSGSSILIPIIATKKINVSHSSATMFNYFQSRGAIIATLLFAENIFDDYDAIKPMIYTGLFTSIAGSILAYHITQKSNLSYGKAEAMAGFGDMGGITGALLGLQSENYLNPTKRGLLFGSAIGFSSGLFLGRDNRYSAGDGIYLRSAGFIGMYTGLCFTLGGVEYHKNLFYNSVIVGGLTGTLWSHFFAAKSNYSIKESNYISLGTSGIALLGMGLGFLGVNDENFDSSFPLVTSGISSIIGFSYLSWYYYNRNLNKPNKTNNDALSKNIHFQINPAGFISQRKLNNNYMPLPVVNISYSF